MFTKCSSCSRGAENSAKSDLDDKTFDETTLNLNENEKGLVLKFLSQVTLFIDLI